MQCRDLCHLEPSMTSSFCKKTAAWVFHVLNLRKPSKSEIHDAEWVASTSIYLGVEPKIWENPQIIHFNRVFHYKPSIWGAHPYFWKHPSITWNMSNLLGKVLLEEVQVRHICESVPLQDRSLQQNYHRKQITKKHAHQQEGFLHRQSFTQNNQGLVIDLLSCFFPMGPWPWVAPLRALRLSACQKITVARWIGYDLNSTSLLLGIGINENVVVLFVRQKWYVVVPLSELH